MCMRWSRAAVQVTFAQQTLRRAELLQEGLQTRRALHASAEDSAEPSTQKEGAHHSELGTG